MVNIPGILGFMIPGAFSIVRSRQGAVTLPGGPTITAIMGSGQREEVLVERAEGGGADGLPKEFDSRLEPDGRYFAVVRAPVIEGTVQVFLNPTGDGTDVPLVEITDPLAGGAWATEFGIERFTQVDLINGDTNVPPSELDLLVPLGDVDSHLCMVQGIRPATSGRMAKIQLWLEKVAAPLDDIVVRIFGADGADNPTGVGTQLATVTLDNGDIPASGSGTWVDIEFDLEISAQRAELTEGKLYFIRLERSGGVADAVNYFAVGTNNDNPLGLGQNRREGDIALWPVLTTYATEDLIFRTYLNRGNFGVSYDLYGPAGSAGTIDEDDFGIDAYGGESYGTGFFDSKYGRRYNKRTVRGEAEPQHYYFDYETGQLVLDHALEQGDRLLCIYVAERDMNEFELFFDLQELYNKHGYPSLDNTISQAAYMAFLNGAPVLGTITAGSTYNSTTGRWVTDPFWADAFEALEKEDINFVLPVVRRDVIGEVVVDSYDSTTMAALTGNGWYLQESAGGGDEPGINLYPLACDENDEPIRFELYKNGVELVYNVDYTLDFICEGSAEPTKIEFLLQPLVDGDRVVANYEPDMDLVATVQTVAMSHVEFMSSTRQRRERILWTGAYTGFGFDEVLDPVTGVANVFGRSFRVVYMFPERIRTVINGETAYLDGQFLAACAAGKLSGISYLPEPLTRKELVGFDLESDMRFSIDQLNLLGDDGLTVVTPLSSGGRVVYGITTVQSGNPVEEEISIVRIRDYVAQVCREILESRFVGTVIDDRTVPSVKTATNAILESLVAQRIITQFANLVARVDAQEPRQVNVSFDVAPVFPLNWIKIEFSIGVL